jgi:hypothetical protein
MDDNRKTGGGGESSVCQPVTFFLTLSLLLEFGKSGGSKAQFLPVSRCNSLRHHNPLSTLHIDDSYFIAL